MDSVRAGVLPVPPSMWLSPSVKHARQVPAVFADLWMVPLFSFFDRVVDIAGMLQRQERSVPNCAHWTGS